MSDKEQIENIVQLYIDSMDESDPDKVKQAFHNNGKVVGYLHGDFMQMSTNDFADFVASQQPPPEEKGENVIFLYTGGSPAIFAYNEDIYNPKY